jgi:D-amino-acid dehydrogenase
MKVLVAGGGVIGLCTAYYAARRGFDVTVLERRPNTRDSCSSGNAGMIVPSHFVPLAAPGMVALGLKWMWNPRSPFYVKPRLDPELLSWAGRFWRAATPARVARAAPLLRDLSFASRACYEELAALPGVDFGLVRRGLLMLCRTERGFHEESRFAARANALGVPAEVLDAGQTAAADPGARMHVVGSVLFPKDCHLAPDRLLASMEAQCRALGVTFVFDAEVTGFAREGSRVAAVRSTAGDHRGDEIVLCSGVWTDGVARGLGLRLPMQAGKGYSLTLKAPRELPLLCSILSEARCAVTPMGGALRVGGTMELAGLNEDVSPVRVQGIVESFCRYYPAFTPRDFEGVEPWRGLRPCSPDGLPYIGRPAALSNVVVATGHAMMGLSLAPVTATIVSALLAREAPGWDLSLLSPDRYH